LEWLPVSQTLAGVNQAMPLLIVSSGIRDLPIIQKKDLLCSLVYLTT
jgi:hypothetical protein